MSHGNVKILIRSGTHYSPFLMTCSILLLSKNWGLYPPVVILFITVQISQCKSLKPWNYETMKPWRSGADPDVVDVRRKTRSLATSAIRCLADPLQVLHAESYWHTMTIMTRLASSSITSIRLNLGMYSIEMRNSPLETQWSPSSLG